MVEYRNGFGIAREIRLDVVCTTDATENRDFPSSSRDDTEGNGPP